METKSNITPSDLGFKDLEILYNPPIWEETGSSLNNSNFTKQVTLGALVIMLNLPSQDLTAQTNKLNFNTNSSTSNEDVKQLISSLDVESIIYTQEINTVIEKSKLVELDEQEISEQEIIDAYMVEAKKFYPKKRKISL